MVDVDELFADPPFVGRHADLARLAGLLGGRPALGVVRGSHGSGRSTILIALRRIADARGWRTLQTEPIRPDTDRESLERQLRMLVGLPETVVSSGTDTPGARAGARVQAMGPDAPDSDTPGSEARADGMRTIADGLVAQPTLLLLDDYRPDRDVERWLLSKVLGPLKGRMTSVLIVVAGRIDDLEVVLAEADPDVVVDAQPPTEAEVRAHLSALGTHLDPQVRTAELDALVAGLVAEPQFIAPLIRTLAYGRADG